MKQRKYKLGLPEQLFNYRFTIRHITLKNDCSNKIFPENNLPDKFYRDDLSWILMGGEDVKQDVWGEKSVFFWINVAYILGIVLEHCEVY